MNHIHFIVRKRRRRRRRVEDDGGEFAKSRVARRVWHPISNRTWPRHRQVLIIKFMLIFGTIAQQCARDARTLSLIHTKTCDGTKCLGGASERASVDKRVPHVRCVCLD